MFDQFRIAPHFRDIYVKIWLIDKKGKGNKERKEKK